MRSVSSFDFVLTGKRGGVRCPHGKLGVQPVRSAGARHSGARGQCGTSVSQIAIFIIADMQICTKWKLQSEGLTRRHLCNATPHATPNPSAEPLQPGDTLLQPVSNDTYPTTPPRERHLSNTATKGL